MLTEEHLNYFQMLSVQSDSEINYSHVFSRWSDRSDNSGPGHVRKTATAGGQAAREGVEAGGYLSGLELQGAGRHPSGGERRDHAEAEDAGGVEEQKAAGRGYGVPPVEECGGPG